MKLSRIEIICIVLVGMVMTTMPCRADTLCPPDSYVQVDGRSCLKASSVKALAGCQLRISGVILGGGKLGTKDGFYDVRTTDGTPLRINWSFALKLEKGKPVTFRGWLDKPGHILAAGHVLI